MSNSRFDNARDRSPIGRGDGPDAKKGRFDRGPRSRRGPTEKRVYVSNVPYETKWQEIKDLFKEKVGNVAFVELFNDEKGKPRGCGIVEFDDKEMAKQAVDVMDKYEINGRKIVVKEDVDADRDRTGRIMKGGFGDRQSFSDRSSGYQGPAENNRNLQKNGFDRRDSLGRLGNSSDPSSKYGNTFGLNAQFLESLGIEGPIVSRIFVANLDYKVDEKKLNEVFKMAGKVASVELNKDRDGNSRGHGTVEYEHPVEAVQAISMFKDVSLYDRKMSVRMDSAAVREEQLGGVPTKLPVGLKNIGMGLGAGGAPLKNVSSNLPSQQSGSSSSAPAPAGGLAAALGGSGLLQNIGAAALQNQALQSQLTSALGLGGGGGLGGSGLGSGLGGASLGSSSGLGSGLGSGIGGGIGSGLSGLGSGGGLGSGLQSNDRAYGNSSGGGGYSDNRSGRLMDTIVVKNLPPSYSWQSLREKLSNIGEVKFAEMRENGIGVVRFATEKDAERAVNLMDRTRIDNYMVDVYLF